MDLSAIFSSITVGIYFVASSTIFSSSTAPVNYLQ